MNLLKKNICPEDFPLQWKNPGDNQNLRSKTFEMTYPISQRMTTVLQQGFCYKLLSKIIGRPWIDILIQKNIACDLREIINQVLARQTMHGLGIVGWNKPIHIKQRTFFKLVSKEFSSDIISH